MKPGVLIVAASLTVRMALHEAFAEAGFQSEACATAGEALAALARGVPSLLVMDLSWADGEAPPLLAAIKAADRRPRVMLLANQEVVAARLQSIGLAVDAFAGDSLELPAIVALGQSLAALPRDRLSVLLIDDSPTFRHALTGVLELAGYAVVPAGSGEEGLRLAALSPPDAAIIDGNLPGIDGATVIRRMRLDPALSRVPCLLLTASDKLADEFLALDAGADGFARKSEDTAFITARLGALLRVRDEGASLAAPAHLGPKRVLVVDDSPTFLHEVEAQLGAEDYTVFLATSGEEALALLSAQPVDCILLDMNMPGLTGAETCRRIKSLPVLRDIPLAILSAADDPRSVIDGLNAGADDYIPKSSDFEVIRVRLRAQLRRKHFEDENRRIRQGLVQKELETTQFHAALELAETRAVLLADLERKNAELELARAGAEAASLAKSSFLANMSHELRTPLNAILGYAELLREEAEELGYASFVADLQRIHNAGALLSRLINDTLDLSKIESGKMELDAEEFAIGPMIRDITDTLQPLVAKGRNTFKIDLHEPLPIMYTDATKLRQALINLVGNAAKFCKDGEIGLGVRAETRQGGVWVTFKVSDTGIGIGEQHLATLFEEFSQGDASTTKRYGGTGLGLAISRRFCRMMGGEISVASVVGEGASFTIELPVRLPEPSELA